jgi:hypothetical protein
VWEAEPRRALQAAVEGLFALGEALETNCARKRRNAGWLGDTSSEMYLTVHKFAGAWIFTQAHVYQPTIKRCDKDEDQPAGQGAKGCMATVSWKLCKLRPASADCGSLVVILTTHASNRIEKIQQ